MLYKRQGSPPSWGQQESASKTMSFGTSTGSGSGEQLGSFRGCETIRQCRAEYVRHLEQSRSKLEGMVYEMQAMIVELGRMRERELERDAEHQKELQAIAPKPCQRCSGMRVITEAQFREGLPPRKHPGMMWDPEAHEWDI